MSSGGMRVETNTKNGEGTLTARTYGPRTGPGGRAKFYSTVLCVPVQGKPTGRPSNNNNNNNLMQKKATP